MKPIFHISLGRSGTTLAMRLLASHPQVIANEAYPLEFRPMWSVLKPDDLLCREELVAPQYRFDGWEETIGRALSERGCIEEADTIAAYALMSKAAGKNASYFVEKTVWRHADEVATRFPEARFSCTIRDPRDLLVSVRAFNAKRGFDAFLAREGDSDETITNNYLHAYESVIMTADAVGAAVVRYEDLLTSPADTVANLYFKLGLESSADIATRSWQRAHAMENGSHRTSQAGLVERWRKELPTSLQDLYRDRLGHVLNCFGYPLD